ncbi:MAG TPA: creatininase family protein [Burkholderiaceae bacterium]|nr:creatininase family protein [Burkholderiaceae bacterium]
MTFSSRYWDELKPNELSQHIAANASDVVVVLPVAATEQHGPHLPLSVDVDLVEGIVHACLPHLPKTSSVLFLPTQKVGLSSEHLQFAGTQSLSPADIIHQWVNMGAQVARTGVKKLLLFNSHGGNVAVMDIVARELRAHQNIMVFSSSWYNLPLGDAESAFSKHELRFGVHAGDVETSMMLALKPELVQMDKAQDFSSSSHARSIHFPILGNGKSAKFGWQMQDINPYGAAGNAANATAEKGQALVDAAGKQLALLLQEITQLPLSTLVSNTKR